MKVIIDNIASHEDLIKLAKILHDILEDIIAGDYKTNYGLKLHQKHLKEQIIKGE